MNMYYNCNKIKQEKMCSAPRFGVDLFALLMRCFSISPNMAFTGLLIFCAGLLAAQQPYRLQLSMTPTERTKAVAEIKEFSVLPQFLDDGRWQFEFPDSLGAAPLCNQLVQYFQERSYLTASIDTFTQTGRTTTAHLYLGPAMYWVRLLASQDKANEAWLLASGFREKLYQNKPFYYKKLLQLQRQLLEQAENNGFPFAKIQLEQIQIDSSGGISAQLTILRNQFITYKDLNIVGDLKLPGPYLRNFLGIQKGSPYNRAQILRLRDQLRTLSFVEQTGNPSINFTGKEATINLFLNKKRASRFDFIIGILPQSDGRPLLTGTLSAAFQNALNLGERMSVEFERLRPETQRLEVSAGLPYLFGTAFGVDGQLRIYRRDSSWVDAQGDLGIQYFLPGGDYLRFFWENKSSGLQKVDTLTIQQTKQLPANLDLRQNGFGIEAVLNRLDYRFNPRKGWAISIKGVAGYNNVLRNNQIEAIKSSEIPAFNYGSLYDSLAGKVTRYRGELQVDYFLPFFKRSTLKLGMRAGGLFSNKPIFTNEQYRLGGNKRLRGFNEESLFATRFAILTAEARLLLGLNAYFSAFADYAYIENVSYRTRLFSRPLGLGVGMNFETKAGIFGISIAVGRLDVGQGVDFRSTKFHLGYVSLF